MAALKLICSAAMKGDKPLDGPVAVELVAHYPWPKALKHPLKQLRHGGWRTGRPDLDNLMKLVGDALNNIAWLDDAQIARSTLAKVYSDMPGLRVRIEALG